MIISEAKFKSVFPASIEGIYKLIAKHIGRVCKTKEQEAMFLAQCGAETGYKVFSENLNYSREALLRVFRKYFTPQAATEYARNPVLIANRVYANRMGNGDEASGDGWRFRGQGLIQLTGKNNYRTFKAWLVRNYPIYANADLDRLHENLELCVLTAIWYWEVNNLSEIKDILVVTRRVNGGTHGLEYRKAYYDKLIRV